MFLIEKTRFQVIGFLMMLAVCRSVSTEPERHMELRCLSIVRVCCLLLVSSVEMPQGSRPLVGSITHRPRCQSSPIPMCKKPTLLKPHFLFLSVNPQMEHPPKWRSRLRNQLKKASISIRKNSMKWKVIWKIWIILSILLWKREWIWICTSPLNTKMTLYKKVHVFSSNWHSLLRKKVWGSMKVRFMDHKNQIGRFWSLL